MKISTIWMIEGIILLLAISSNVCAQIPEYIHFQGMLTDQKGQFITSGQHSVLFSIWDQKTVNSQSKPIWKERHLVTIENGVYNVLLGSHTSFSDPDNDPSTSDALTFAIPYYLDIICNNRSLTTNGQLFPMTSVWTAFRSQTSVGRLLTVVNQPYDIHSTDDILLVKGGTTINLPKASLHKNRIITIKKSDSNTKSVQINCHEKDTIAASHTLSTEKRFILLTKPFEDITLISDGHKWWELGQGKMAVDHQLMIPYARLNLENAILTKDITDGTISHVDISPQAGITYQQLNIKQSIQGDDIVIDGIDSSHIKNQTISNIDIASNASIAYSKLNLDASITGKDIVDNTILSSHIKNQTISNIDIASNASIAYSKLNLNTSITGKDIVDNTILSSHIQDQSISNIDIATNASIAYSKLHLEASIQSKDIANNAIASNHIKDHSIKNSDIQAKAEIAYSKLSLEHSIQHSDLTHDSVDTKNITNETIVNDDISNDANIQYHKLNLVRAIQHRDLKSETVDSDIIQNKTIRNIDIADNARIQYKKLDLTDSIKTIDIKDHVIIPSKLNHVNAMGDQNQALVSDGQGGFQWKNIDVLDHVYVVGQGSAYETIADALSEAKTHRQPVLIKLAPGIYNEQVVTRENTCIEGSGQNITIIRYSGGTRGNASSATVVGYTNVEIRDLTIISDASQQANQNAIALFNPSSVSIKNVTIKAYGGTSYNYGIYNDRSEPIICRTYVSVRSTVSEESWNYGIYNESSNAHIDNVDIQSWGGDRTFGIANKSSFPVIHQTRVRCSAGVMKNRGIWNESSSPRICHSEVIVSGVCHDNYGIENYNNSSPIIKNSMVKAVGLTSFGLYQWGSSKDSIKIYSSTIAGETNCIYGSSATFLLANSQLEGDISGQTTCVSSYNQHFLMLDKTCHLED
jgi:hypothetical protein